MTPRRRLLLLVVTAGVALFIMAPIDGASGAGQSGDRSLKPGTRLFAPGPGAPALQQIQDLRAAGDDANAELIAAMSDVPRAVWITQGTKREARDDVKSVMKAARAQDAVPVLVAYNIPGRDCGGFSAGGARTTDEYLSWIDGVAAGIGGNRVVVVLEPDGLGLLPSDCGGPNPDYPFTDEERYAQLNAAVDRLARQPHAIVFLDGTHSHWLSVGDIASRLVQAGAMRAQGFFLNVSNFRATQDGVKYGTWISKCIAFANNPDDGGWRLGHYDWCASQYFSPFGPVNPDDYSTWVYTDQWYDANLGNAVPTARFVVDTSRNGQGPWAGPQDWCNPPGRGLGLRPTVDTGAPLLEAFLWVKVPGESDGQCRGPIDPEWGVADPPAGQWFPQQALQLAQLASPPLEP